MRLRNTTDIPNEIVRQIIRFTMPSGVTNIDVELRNTRRGHYGGRAYVQGCHYHRNTCKFVVLRVGTCKPKLFPFLLTPYQYGQHKDKKVWIANRIEMLVYIAAHELRHMWQSNAKNKAGYVWGSRGRFSEVDTEAYAKRKLREWRKVN